MAGAEALLLSVARVNGCEVSLDAGGNQCFAWDWARVPVVRGLRRSSGLACALRELAPKAEVIHDHGLWLMPNVNAGRAALRAGTPFIVAPRGMLAPAALAFSPLKKRIVWALVQGDVVRRASCIHVTSEQEHDEIRDFGLTNPIAIVPNGIDIPDLDYSTAVTEPGRDRIVLSLGRIHPKKGLDCLLHAWARLEPAYPRWRLRIVGSDELGHAAELAQLARKLKTQRVSIEDPIAGDAKTLAYSTADLFVLTSLNENFAMTVAEALAAGTPVIATKGAPWHGLTREACGWWIDHGVEALVAALTEAMTMGPERLQEMGTRGRKWMARDFSWDRIAREMLDVYYWLSSGGEPPQTIRYK
jgi:glycosyltransferase involved in cell wall biosynthesis